MQVLGEWEALYRHRMVSLSKSLGGWSSPGILNPSWLDMELGATLGFPETF